MSSENEFRANYCPDQSNAGATLATAHRALHAGDRKQAAFWISEYLTQTAGGVDRIMWNFIQSQLIPDHGTSLRTSGLFLNERSGFVDIYDIDNLSVTVIKKGQPGHQF